VPNTVTVCTVLRMLVICLSLQLRKKTAEVTKACEKHYALEQELAFYKIDHKFDSLSQPPVIHTSDSSVVCCNLCPENKIYYKLHIMLLVLVDYTGFINRLISLLVTVSSVDPSAWSL